MTIDVSRSDFTIGVIGAGVMGRGIAQVAAEAGFIVLLADAQASAVEAAAKACADMIRRKAEKGQIDEAAAEAAIARLRKTGAGPDAGWAEFASCDLVIEAVVERMDVKHAVVAGLEAVVRDECVIASNTSSLSVTGIAAKARLPGRVAGFHFFNPVPLMRVVEVVGGVMTAEWALDALTRSPNASAITPCARPTRPAFSSTTPVAPSAPRRCASSRKESRASPTSTAS
jgi:3-hydroxybutyryl-CoA dehydrogenase